MFAENHKFKNVQIITAEEYLVRNTIISRIERFEGTHSARKTVVARALQLAGKPYDLINYNCEHFVNEAITGKANSLQVANFFVGLLSVLFIGLLLNTD